ncbi:MAG: cobyrinate a,c-diamide synthase [Desulfuromonadales bacterium]|nr:cobyrinate a,c-diamide synthase [Desulfuromonadales bacterium]
MNGFLIAAPQSGSGKTTVALAIMAAFSRRGMTVAPFKCGPDFIDPGYHQAVTGNPSINLDGWMCGEEFVLQTFLTSLTSLTSPTSPTIAVIEGVMGLFDGIGASSTEGSSAQIAAIVGAPVVLVVNARGMAASGAALVKGFVEFDPRIRVAGVIFNNVGSNSHAELLRQALRDALPEVAVLGCIPRDEGLAIPSRHLGLVTAGDHPLPDGFIERLAEMAETYLDLAGLAGLGFDSLRLRSVQAAQPADSTRLVDTISGPESGVEPPVRIAVARDAAFCFCYDDNLRLLREAGAEIVFFSPLADDRLPPDISGIYLPGGYPELHAEQLAANVGIRKAVLTAIRGDMPVYAECGGLIYLTEGLEGGADFVGVFPVRTRMLPKRKALGFRQVETGSDCCIAGTGAVARGHEFHYSEINAMPAAVERCYHVSRQGRDLADEGYRYRNCLASYIHLHFGSNPNIASSFVSACKRFSAMLQDHTKQLPV